jgi:dipeptidyl aminopeptidase/acylaminoacyl peptidase
MASTDIQESGYDDTLKRALKEELGERKDLRPISPVNFAAQADAPILLIHGKDDTVVPYGRARPWPEPCARRASRSKW